MPPMHFLRNEKDQEESAHMRESQVSVIHPLLAHKSLAISTIFI